MRALRGEGPPTAGLKPLARELVRLGHLEHLEAIHTPIRILSPLHLRIEAVGPHSDINEIRNRRQTFSRRSNSRLENYKRVTVLGYVWTIGKTFAANPESNINISAMGQRGRASHAVDGVRLLSARGRRGRATHAVEGVRFPFAKRRRR